MVNWKRGLHRIFYIGCALWFVYVLAVIPIQMVNQQYEFAATTWSLDTDSGMSFEERKKRHDSLVKEANIFSVYSSLLSEQYIALLVIGYLLIPPAIVYGLTRAFWSLFKWLRDGFSRQ